MEKEIKKNFVMRNRNYIEKGDRYMTKLSKTEEVKKAVATLTDVSISMSSVELTQTAGNEIRQKVKVYDVDPVKAEKLAMAIMERHQKRFKVNK